MRSDYCPVANEPCQSMCLGDCCLRKGVRHAALEAELAACKSRCNAAVGQADALRQELADMKAAMGDPVAWHTEDHLTDRSATTYDKNMLYRWQSKGWPITQLYAIKAAK